MVSAISSRIAIDRRTLQEVASLLMESEAVLSEYFEGTRNCPEEDCQEITQKYVDSFGLYQRISERWLVNSSAIPPCLRSRTAECLSQEMTL
jgi:hypothetical protein